MSRPVVESFEAFKVAGVWLASINGRTRRIEDWCSDFGISYPTVRCRINRQGWSVRSALLVKSAGVPDRPGMYAERLGVSCFKSFAADHLAAGGSQAQLARMLDDGVSTVQWQLRQLGLLKNT